MSSTIADLMNSIQEDPWRTKIGFSSELMAALDVALNPSTDDIGIAKVFNEWISKYQPCLFGRIAAKNNQITLEELEGGTFTITNGGVYGSLLSTPIVNPPQSGVLGMHGIFDRPMAVNGQVVIRPMMYIALTYDHRVVDGREAVSFLKLVKDLVEEPTRLILEV